jgi:hypothetical protein
MPGHQAAPRYLQDGYRVRNDFAGPNEDADWKEAVNTPWKQVPNENFRVRFLVTLQARFNLFSGYFDLYASHNGGPFRYVDNADEFFTTDSILHAIDSNVAEYVEFENTTSLIPGVNPYLVNDNFGIVESTGFTPNSTWPGTIPIDGLDTECEFEFCLTLRDEFVSNGDTIILRVFINDTLFVEGYPQEAILTVEKGISRGNITTAAARFTDNLELEHTVALGADAALIVLLGASDAVTPVGTFIPTDGVYTTTVTWSGGLVTQTGSVQAVGLREDPYLSAYLLTGPTVTGTQTLSVTVDTDINYLFVAAIDYHSVDQSDPLLDLAISSTADPNFQLGGAGLLPTATGRGITTCLCSETDGLHVGGSGQVGLFNELEGHTRFSGFDKVIPGSGYFPMTITNLADYTSVSLSVALRPA